MNNSVNAPALGLSQSRKNIRPLCIAFLLRHALGKWRRVLDLLRKWRIYLFSYSSERRCNLYVTYLSSENVLNKSRSSWCETKKYVAAVFVLSCKIKSRKILYRHGFFSENLGKFDRHTLVCLFPWWRRQTRTLESQWRQPEATMLCRNLQPANKRTNNWTEILCLYTHAVGPYRPVVPELDSASFGECLDDSDQIEHFRLFRTRHRTRRRSGLKCLHYSTVRRINFV